MNKFSLNPNQHNMPILYNFTNYPFFAEKNVVKLKNDQNIT